MKIGHYFLILCSCGSTLTVAAPVAEVAARFLPDSPAYRISGPGIEDFQADFSATVEIDGQRRTLRSQDGKIVGKPAASEETTPYGSSDITTTAVAFAESGITLHLRLGTLPGEQAVLLQTAITNQGSKSIRLISLSAMEPMKLVLAGAPADWFATAYAQSTNGGPPNYIGSLDELEKGLNIREYGSVYRKDGMGFLFGPVGEPLAYLENHVSSSKDGCE